MSKLGRAFKNIFDSQPTTEQWGRNFRGLFSISDEIREFDARCVSDRLGIEFNLVIAIMSECCCTSQDVLVNMSRLERNTGMNSEKAIYRIGNILRGKSQSRQAEILARKMGRGFYKIWPFIRYLIESESRYKPVLTYRTNGERIAYRSR